MNSRTWSTWPAVPGQRRNVVALTADLLVRVARHFRARRPSDEAIRARDAAHVREMARRHQASEPGFASDLYAAADRHLAAADARR